MYKAIVCTLKAVRPHPNADRLKLATVFGNQIVVGLDNVDGQKGIFFPCDGQLSDEFLKANDLYPRFDESGKRVGGGFFDPKNRRVRAQKFRGEKSDGFWLPIESLNNLVLSESITWLKDGDELTSYAGHELCRKYETPATKEAGQRTQKQGSARKKHPLFKEHVDTEQFGYKKTHIPVGSVIHISEKVHGTSARYGFFKEDRPFHPNRVMNFILFWIQWAVFWLMSPNFKGPPVARQDSLLVGSRRVQLKGPESSTSYYGDENFRFDVARHLEDNLRLGETVYGELVGYSHGGSLIMGSQGTSELPEVKARYGDTMEYRYGCKPGESKFYVYRITLTSANGSSQELTVEQVKARCKELGLEYVPEFTGALITVPGSEGLDRMGIEYPLVVGGDTGSLQGLEKVVEGFLDGPSTLDPTHIREGVVVRVDTPDGRTYFLKQKNFNFKVLEGIIKNSDTYVDTEEAA